MIPKISSSDLNALFQESKNDLDKIYKCFENSKKDMESKLNVINYESQYVSKMITDITRGNYTQEPYKIALGSARYGKFETYGSTAYPKPIKELNNVFNLNMSGIGEHFFREDVKVLINDIEKESYLDILKHDTMAKGIVFDLYKEPEVVITVEVDQPKNLLGPTRFNMIEIDPYLPGSFDVKEIVIYSYDSNGEINPVAEHIGLSEVGKSRILLEKKYNMCKIEFHIQLNYRTYQNDAQVYPFGLKHIYLYDADFTRENYVIVPIRSNEYISIVKNEIKVFTPMGEEASQIDLEDIELYVDYDEENDELTSPIEQSYPNVRKEIARNTKVIYAKIPLTHTKSLIAVQFNIENKLF